jgi:hypothetical protein
MALGSRRLPALCVIGVEERELIVLPIGCRYEAQPDPPETVAGCGAVVDDLQRDQYYESYGEDVAIVVATPD